MTADERTRRIKEFKADLQLEPGYDVRENKKDGKYFPIYTLDDRRIAQVQLQERDPDARLWLLKRNAATRGLFTVTGDQTLQGGYCAIRPETVEACRRALMLADLSYNR